MTEETREETEVATVASSAIMPVATTGFGALTDLKERMEMLKTAVQDVMEKDRHFGLIPGCGKKPALYKAGAEFLGVLFQHYPTYRVECEHHENGHRTYTTHATMHQIGTDHIVGAGVGVCSTLESKYRYRKAERKCPACGEAAIKESKPQFGGGWYCWKKIGGCGQNYNADDARIVNQVQGQVENEDIADQYNTCIKMSKKRAQVDGVLTSTGASEYFTQDIEDMFNNGVDTIDITPQPVEPEVKAAEEVAMKQPPMFSEQGMEEAGEVLDQAPSGPTGVPEYDNIGATLTVPREDVVELPHDQKVEVDELIEGPVTPEPEPSQPAEAPSEAPQAPKLTKDYGNTEPLPEELCAKICQRFLDVPLLDANKKPTGKTASLTQKELEAIMRKPAHEWEGRHGKHLNRLFQAVKHGANLDAVRGKRYMRDFDDSALEGIK